MRRKRDWIRTLAIKLPAEAGFHNWCLPKQNPLTFGELRTLTLATQADFSYVQPDERHGKQKPALRSSPHQDSSCSIRRR